MNRQLPATWTAGQLEERFAARLETPVHITITRNRVRMITIEKKHGVFQMRLHAMFLQAPVPILEAIANWMAKPQGGHPQCVQQFIRQELEKKDGFADYSLPEKEKEIIKIETREVAQYDLFGGETSKEIPVKKAKIKPEPLPNPLPEFKDRPVDSIETSGEVYDLAKLLKKVNREYFQNKMDVRIRFGKDTSHQKVHSRRLGSYSHKKNLVTIHPLLDNPDVPQQVVEFTIYHELLHALQPKNIRRPHNPKFKELERKHPEYNFVRKWEKDNLDYLLSRK